MGIFSATLTRAIMLNEGLGAPKDQRQSSLGLIALAKLGVPDAQALLSEQYMLGGGVLQNLLSGYLWIIKANANKSLMVSLGKVSQVKKSLLDKGVKANTLT